MTITQLTPTEFQFESEGDNEVGQMQALTKFEYENRIYLVKKITLCVDAGSYKSYFVVVR